MTDDEIREIVRAKLADGTLPRHLAPLGTGGPLNPAGTSPTAFVIPNQTLSDLCAACGKGATHVRHQTAVGNFAFHNQCERIWREEADRL